MGGTHMKPMTRKAMAVHEKTETRAMEKRESPAHQRMEKRMGVEKHAKGGR